MESGEWLDWMLIDIVKEAETDVSCEYRFSTNVWAPDPNRPRRYHVVREISGVLRINKADGEIELVRPMPGDDGRQVAGRAASKVHRHWSNGEYPRTMTYQAG